MLKAESHLLDFNGEFVVLQQEDKCNKGNTFLIHYYNHKLLKIDRFVCAVFLIGILLQFCFNNEPRYNMGFSFNNAALAL